MRYAISLVCLVTVGLLHLNGQELCPHHAKATALLHLQAAAKQRAEAAKEEQAHAAASEMFASLNHVLLPERETPLAFAVKQAKEEGELVFLWVGGCAESIRADFPEATHYRLPAFQGDKTRRLILPQQDGDYYWDEADLTPVGVKNFLQRLRLRRQDKLVPAIGFAAPQEGGCSGGQCSPRGRGLRLR